jgi:hypothetical protein
MKRWQSASQQWVLEVPIQWILNKGEGALENALRQWAVDKFRSARPRACLGLFASAEALGLGFVHGVEPHLYLERMSGDVAESLGLSAAEPQRVPGRLCPRSRKSRKPVSWRGHEKRRTRERYPAGLARRIAASFTRTRTDRSHLEKSTRTRFRGGIVNAEVEPFARFVEAVEPWLGDVAVIGGWVIWKSARSGARTRAQARKR